MSTDKGYIKLYRDIRDHWLWSHKPFTIGQAWIDLLMMANHEDKEIMINGHLVKVKRGSCVTSLRKLAEKWGRDKRTVSRYLKMLEDNGMIVRMRPTEYTTLTIVNYGIYQDSRDSKRPTKSPPNVPPNVPPSTPPDAPKQYTIEDTIEDTKKKKPSGQTISDDDDDGMTPEEYMRRKEAGEFNDI